MAVLGKRKRKKIRKGRGMEKANMKGALKKIYAQAVCGEEDGGSEIVQVVIVLGFAVGLGAALISLQGQINTAIKGAGDSITQMFKSVTKGAATGVQ